MRYFKYDGVPKTSFEKRRNKLRSINPNTRKVKVLRRLFLAITITVFVLILGLGAYALSLISTPEALFEAVLSIIGRGLLVLTHLLLSIILTAIITTPLWNIVDHLSYPDRSIQSDACKYLRKYYGIGKKYIVTKCYSSSDYGFIGHDICVFIADGELRLTVDLVFGFLYENKDRGCYAFDRNTEIQAVTENNKNALKISCGETYFLIGERANSFIKNEFLMTEKEGE